MKVRSYNRLISIAAVLALLGFILSGPVAYLVVHWLSPQPGWTSAAVFAHNYETLQDLPYYFGFLLVAGMLMLSIGHYLNYSGLSKGRRFNLFLSLVCTILFAALICINYIAQISFVHNLALNYQPQYDAAIATFSMANPLSFCWANEMWGYGFLGIATWLMAHYYRDENVFLCRLLRANGVVSVVSAIWIVIDVNWVMTSTGLVAYFAWNVLMIVTMLLIYVHMRLRSHPGYVSSYSTLNLPDAEVLNRL